MNFYTRQHRHYCGIDLHARAMYVCVLYSAGTVLVHRNLTRTPDWSRLTTSRAAQLQHDNQWPAGAVAQLITDI